MKNIMGVPYFKKCGICGREILLELFFAGIPHVIGEIVTCKECLKKKGITEKYKKEHPEDAKKIQEWLDK